ncbi:MAG: TonB-dependent receptor domain-containing protein [Opitutales bacterium]
MAEAGLLVCMRRLLIFGFLTGFGLLAGRGQPVLPEELPSLEPFDVFAPRVAVDAPAGAIAMPVSALRYEPAVDVQSRNQAEAQADVVLRGSTFENTGLRLGPVPFLDPQTGHYLMELPLGPHRLTGPAILLDSANTLGGFNSTAGALVFGLGAVRPGGRVSASVGSDGFQAGSLRVGGGDDRSGWDIDLAGSRSDGPIRDGDHEFLRTSARILIRHGAGTTHMLAGYQDKFFGWPNLYAAPFGASETEDIQTWLLAVLHEATVGGDADWQAGVAYRQNRDHYQFNRYSPDDRFRHRTETLSGGFALRSSAEAWSWELRLQALADQIRSTNLTRGDFDSRAYANLGGRLSWQPAPDGPEVSGILAYQATDRDGGRWAPAFRVSLPASKRTRVIVEASRASQVPGYTAIAAPPTSGLFRGNPDLGWETSDTLAAKVRWAGETVQLQAELFHRQDEDLTDWTFRFPGPGQIFTARTANPVDLRVTGLSTELLWQPSNRWDVLVSGHLLRKEADYGGRPVDASFYALNYPLLRATFHLLWRPDPAWQVALDTEWRHQEANALRTTGDTALLSTLEVTWQLPVRDGLEVTAVVDNLWDEAFEEVPGTPGTPRTWSLRVSRRW